MIAFVPLIASVALAEIPFGGEPSWDLLSDRCPEVLAEDYACLALTTHPSIQLIGLDSGTECFIEYLDAADVSHVSTSTVWWGDHLYSCAGVDGRMVRISLRDFGVEWSETFCETASAWGGDLLVRGTDKDWPHAQMYLCEDWEELEDDTCRDLGFADANFTQTVRDDVLWSAWHSTDRIERLDLDAMEELEPLVLQDYDGWIMGQAFIDDELLVLTTWEDLLVIDPDSGALQWSVPVPYYSGATFCFDTAQVPMFSGDGDGDAVRPGDLDAQGCGCTATARGGAAPGVLLALLGLCGLRRRR
jgi:hypothetical protein